MPEPPSSETRPYHHGDLRRALVEAARQLLETEGPSAMSLRAVARQAGVSPAAPYHHFKDKGELLEAVAAEGWAVLGGEMMAAMEDAASVPDPTPVLLAYVHFARTRPALYRIMFDGARSAESLPFLTDAPEGSPFALLRERLALADDCRTVAEIELAIAASWSAVHGLAEMAGFKQFEHLKAELGGELPFLEAVLRRMKPGQIAD
jgi:AcrR family transcriptional regulator